MTMAETSWNTIQGRHIHLLDELEEEAATAQQQLLLLHREDWSFTFATRSSSSRMAQEEAKSPRQARGPLLACYRMFRGVRC
jgi:hypothetical protein